MSTLPNDLSGVQNAPGTYENIGQLFSTRCLAERLQYDFGIRLAEITGTIYLKGRIFFSLPRGATFPDPNSSHFLFLLHFFASIFLHFFGLPPFRKFLSILFHFLTLSSRVHPILNFFLPQMQVGVWGSKLPSQIKAESDN